DIPATERSLTGRLNADAVGPDQIDLVRVQKQGTCGQYVHPISGNDVILPRRIGDDASQDTNSALRGENAVVYAYQGNIATGARKLAFAIKVEVVCAGNVHPICSQIDFFPGVQVRVGQRIDINPIRVVSDLVADN